MTARGYRAFIKASPVKVMRNVALRKHSTFRIGGAADLFVIPKTVEELKSVLLLARKHKIRIFVIGNASNVLFPDSGFRGLVIKLANGLNTIKINGNKVLAGSGVLLACLVKALSREGLSGLEFAFGVPASVGGAAIMNFGAYGHRIGDLIERVFAVNLNGEEIEIPKRKLKFSYRGSNLWDKNFVVTRVELKLRRGRPKAIKERVRAFLDRRLSTQPLSIPSAGCVFMNPKGCSAGKLIEESGMSGKRVGDAQVSTKHANFIVNLGCARAQDVLSLIDKVKAAVKQKTGKILAPEVRIIRP